MTDFKEAENKILEKNITSILEEVNRIAKEKNIPTGFTIANSKKYYKNTQISFPPIRETKHIICGNVIVYSEEDAIKLTNIVDGKVDYIFVDAEKKILPSEYGINDAGNIELAVFTNTKISKVLTFKANDLTVNAIDMIISQEHSPLGGKNIAIIGAGNIGSKMALTLLERGARTRLYRRDTEKLKSIVTALNSIKPRGTISSAELAETPEEACENSDIIIGCTPGIPIISKTCIDLMNKNGTIIDIGKGTIGREEIKYAREKGIKLIRGDMRAGFEGTMATTFGTMNLIKNKKGERDINGIKVASGGIMAEEGTIIVDNYKSPKRVIGISNGEGDLKQNITKKDNEKINEILGAIKNGRT
jgi:hypothetical protein